MEGSRNVSSMAQLSSWTEVMKKNKEEQKREEQKRESKVIPKKVDEDDEYDEEFEDYDEDFEDEVPVKAPSKPISQPALVSSKGTYQTTPSIQQPMTQPAQAKANTQAKITPIITPSPVIIPINKAEEKRSDPKQPVSSQSQAKSSTSISSNSISRSLNDPRNVRIQRILSSGVLDLQLEKATIINIMPIAPYDYYLTAVRKPNASIKQIGVPNDIETREMEINTDDILTSDKEIQYCYDDDTSFYQLIEQIKSKNKNSSESKAESKTDFPAIGNTYKVEYNSKQSQDISQNNNDDHSSVLSDEINKFSTFLQFNSNLLEGLILEESTSKTSDSSNKVSLSNNQLLSYDKEYQFGNDKKNGINELIRTRVVSYVTFSVSQPHLFLCCHPYPEDENMDVDLRPFKGLISIWDTNIPGGPIYILECSGQPTTASFSANQNHIIIAGSNDGTMFLWDLRESNSLHKDQDSIDLKISKGIRKTTFSTLFSTGLDGEDNYHNASILQILPIQPSYDQNQEKNQVSVSQFVSIDEKGYVVFWVTNDQSSSDRDDLNMSPWGSLELLSIRKINIEMKRQEISLVNKTNSLGLLSKIQISNPTIALIPSDQSTILVGSEKGEVYRISRAGETSFPKMFIQKEPHLLSPVTCIHVRGLIPNRTSSNYAMLCLVGRENGFVDLYQLDHPFPLLTWSIGSLGSKNNNDNNNQQSKIVFVNWLQDSISCFTVLDSFGNIYYFDLLQDFFQPILHDNISKQSNNKNRICKELVSFSTISSHLDQHRLISSLGGQLRYDYFRLSSSIVTQSLKYSLEDDVNLRERIYQIANYITPVSTLVLSDGKEAESLRRERKDEK